jgi:hypothetical protein
VSLPSFASLSRRHGEALLVNFEREGHLHAGPRDELGKACLGKRRRIALGHKDKLTVRIVLPQSAERPHLVARQRMRGGLATLVPTVIVTRSLGLVGHVMHLVVDHRKDLFGLLTVRWPVSEKLMGGILLRLCEARRA